MSFYKKTMVAGLMLTALMLPAGADTITTDGTNADSPIKVYGTDFFDNGFGTPGNTATIRISTNIRNSSKEDALENVVIKLQLKNGNGKVVEEWSKKVGTLAPGKVSSFENPGVYYNYTYYSLQPNVVVTHDEVEEEEEEKASDDKAVDAKEGSDEVEETVEEAAEEVEEQPSAPAWYKPKEASEGATEEAAPRSVTPQKRFTTAPNPGGTGSMKMDIDKTKQPWE